MCAAAHFAIIMSCKKQRRKFGFCGLKASTSFSSDKPQIAALVGCPTSGDPFWCRWFFGAAIRLAELPDFEVQRSGGEKQTKHSHHRERDDRFACPNRLDRSKMERTSNARNSGCRSHHDFRRRDYSGTPPFAHESRLTIKKRALFIPIHPLAERSASSSRAARQQ